MALSGGGATAAGSTGGAVLVSAGAGGAGGSLGLQSGAGGDVGMQGHEVSLTSNIM